MLGNVDLAAVHELDEEDGVLEGGVLQADDELALARVEVGAGGRERQEEVLEIRGAGGEHHLKSGRDLRE